MAKRHQSALLDVPPNFQDDTLVEKEVSLRQQVLDFYRMLENHPDVNMVSAGMEERPSKAISFNDTTREEQRVVTLRFVMKWPRGAS